MMYLFFWWQLSVINPVLKYHMLRSRGGVSEVSHDVVGQIGDMRFMKDLAALSGKTRS